MTILEAMQNARTFLESLGYPSGDVHDDLNLAICKLQNDHLSVALDVIPEDIQQ